MKRLRRKLISKREWEQQRQAEEASRAALKTKSDAAWEAGEDWNAKPFAERRRGRALCPALDALERRVRHGGHHGASTARDDFA
jgi:hypothetical protein